MDANSLQLSRYETWELDALLQNIERPNPWLLRTFFGRQRFFQTKAIEFDIIDRGRRLAPFVSPLSAGKPMRREGSRTVHLEPAYIKPVALATPQESFTRMPGEAYGGMMSPQQRFDTIVAEHLRLHDEMLDNRLEWMAAQALVYGGIQISGEDYAPVWVDFSRNKALTIELTGAARWNQATSNPIDDLETASLYTRRISKGAVITDAVMDGLTWESLRQHSSVQDLISAFYRRSLPGQTPSSIDQGPRTTINEPQFVGTLNGTIALWVYDSFYQDENGVDTPYLPPYTVLGLAAAALEGSQYYGAIMDLDAGMQAVRMFNKSDKKFNPSALEIVSQSAPLVAPRRPNASFRMTVA